MPRNAEMQLRELHHGCRTCDDHIPEFVLREQKMSNPPWIPLRRGVEGSCGRPPLLAVVYL